MLDEIGVGIASQLSSAPKGRIGPKKVDNAAPRYIEIQKSTIYFYHFIRQITIVYCYYENYSSVTNDVDDLEKRLASLRRL